LPWVAALNHRAGLNYRCLA